MAKSSSLPLIHDEKVQMMVQGLEDDDVCHHHGNHHRQMQNMGRSAVDLDQPSGWASVDIGIPDTWDRVLRGTPLLKGILRNDE